MSDPSAARFARPEYFGAAKSLFLKWPQVDPVLAEWVFVGTVALLVAPKLAVAPNLGIYWLHFGSVLVIVMEVGLFAPPLGVRLYTACAVGRRTSPS